MIHPFCMVREIESGSIQFRKTNSQPMLSDHTNIRLLKTGAMLTLVGPPRVQGRQWGIRAGGPIDAKAAHYANHLVGNHIDTPVLEASLLGPTIEFTGATCYIALTGADFRTTIDGEGAPAYTAIKVRPGSILKMKSAAAGCRAYMAIGGVWDIPQWMGSVSNVTSVLTPESELYDGKSIRIVPNTQPSVTISPIPEILDTIDLDFLPGPEVDLLPEKHRQNLKALTLTVAPDSNRQGLKFTHAHPQLAHDVHIISSGVFPGVIQLTPDGNLILLLADAQTTGGYPRIGVVPKVQLSKLGQACTGTILNLSMLDQDR
jgi:antagonist of KipI